MKPLIINIVSPPAEALAHLPEPERPLHWIFLPDRQQLPVAGIAGRCTRILHAGGCHRGAVKFEVEAEEKVIFPDCNCSICSKSGYLHLIIPRSKFRLLQGQDNLVTYTFGTGEARHLYCKSCGIKSFYIPRSNPDGIDINLRCLDQQPDEVSIEPFDGRSREQHAHELSSLSKDRKQLLPCIAALHRQPA